jgi:hypothetical protein
MTYNPGVPTGTIPLNQDFQNLQDNFTAIDNYIARNHVAFSSNTPQSGYHTAIAMVPAAAPSTIAGFGQIYSTKVNDGYADDESLFYKTGESGGIAITLTRNFLPLAAANGYTFIPGGLIIQWGVVNSPASTGTVLFTTANKNFANNLFNVQLCFQRGSSSGADSFWIDNAKTFDETQFSWRATTSGANKLYWLAIGN